MEEALHAKFEISFEQFHNIVEALVPFTLPTKAALSGKEYQGFVHNGAFIVKVPPTPRDIPVRPA